jgi:vacuolar-type H+-ATPase subunit I/STV1
MTRVQTLELGIENLQSQVQAIRSQRWELEEAFNEKLTTNMSKFFRGVVCEDVVVTATSHSISFSMLDDTNYLREIFQIYLRENYTRERELPYKGIQLSYYTTGAGSDFELTRLENLGRVASVVKGMSSKILEKVNTLAIEFNTEIKEKGFYKQISELEKQISDANSQIRQIQKEEAKAKVFSEEGINF